MDIAPCVLMSNKKVNRNIKTLSSLGGLEPPTFRLTAERANRLRHRDVILHGQLITFDPRPVFANNKGAEPGAEQPSSQRLCFSLFGKYHIQG